MYLRDKSRRHVLVAAATETGKTASTVIMTALEWDGSMLVLDVKEEIYKATAGWRQQVGHVCLKFSPKDREGCARFRRADRPRCSARVRAAPRPHGRSRASDARTPPT